MFKFSRQEQNVLLASLTADSSMIGREWTKQCTNLPFEGLDFAALSNDLPETLFEAPRTGIHI